MPRPPLAAAGAVLAAGLAAFLALTPARAASQTAYTSLYIPAPLENLGHSPRALAMGSAFTAVEGDPACLYYNPAGLSSLKAPALALTHQAWIAGISQENLEAALPLKGAGALALGADYVDFGTLQGYDPAGSPTLAFQPTRFSLTLAWGLDLFPSLALGLAARGLYQSLYESLAPGMDSFATSLCAGVLWRFSPDLKAGAFYSFLPSDASAELGQLKWGAAYRLRLFGESPALFSADLAMPPQGVYQVQCGAEQIFFDRLVLRLGEGLEWKDNQIGGFRGFTLGLGLRWDNLDLDAAFAPDGDLGSSQMAGLTWRFPSGAAKPAALPAVNFAPPSRLSANDKVVHVEMRFNLPAQGPAGPDAAAAPPSGLKEDIQALARKVQENPQDAAAWQALGTLYWRAGQGGFTVQCYQEALQLRPDDRALGAWLEQYRKLHLPPAKAGE